MGSNNPATVVFNTMLRGELTLLVEQAMDGNPQVILNCLTDTRTPADSMEGDTFPGKHLTVATGPGN